MTEIVLRFTLLMAADGLVAFATLCFMMAWEVRND
jgi:hypothetical protein